MRRCRGTALAVVGAIALFALPGIAVAHDPQEPGDPGAGLTSGSDAFHHMRLMTQFPSGTEGARPTNSDIAFWGDRAFVGNYNGFRIFDISATKPKLLADVRCAGAQGDPSVWDRDDDGTADLLILSVDRTMTGPQCGAAPSAHDDPAGWEGLRIFDVEDPSNVTQIATVYQDCGSHTNTLVPREGENRLLVLNSSYPLRPGPTCGPDRGPAAGRHPLHGVIQAVEVPLDNPKAAKEIAELPITYPGDADNKFTPSEHALSGPGLVDGMRACHDMTVFVELNLVSAACAEQAQLWKIGANGLPDTQNPVWTYDQPNVDFWHSATFSWDGRVVNFIDESFGTGCPTQTTKLNLTTPDPADKRTYDTGNMFFVSTATGKLLSEFRIAEERATKGDPIPYCSSHLGNVVPAHDRYLLVNAYYRGGSSVIDFTNPRQPREIAYHDRANADTWSAYWYENKPSQGTSMPVYSNDGVHDPNTGGGFQAFKAYIGPTKRIGLDHLNPQVQENVVPTTVPPSASTAKARRSKYAKGRRVTRAVKVDRAAALRRLG